MLVTPDQGINEMDLTSETVGT